MSTPSDSSADIHRTAAPDWMMIQNQRAATSVDTHRADRNELATFTVYSGDTKREYKSAWENQNNHSRVWQPIWTDIAAQLERHMVTGECQVAEYCKLLPHQPKNVRHAGFTT